jgi:hypothetical protein
MDWHPDLTILNENKEFINFLHKMHKMMLNMNKFSSSPLSQPKKLFQENEIFRMIKEELKPHAIEDSTFHKEISTTVNNTNNSAGYVYNEDKINEMEIDSDSEFININEVKDSNNDDDEILGNFHKCVKNDNNDNYNDKSRHETQPIKTEEMDKKNILKKTCQNCGSSKLSKRRNFCKKCHILKNKKIKNKCGCNSPHCAKGLCKRCYEKNRYKNLTESKMCIRRKRKSKKPKLARKISLGPIDKREKVFKCNSCIMCNSKNQPHYAKGLCRSCYFKKRRDAVTE